MLWILERLTASVMQASRGCTNSCLLVLKSKFSVYEISSPVHAGNLTCRCDVLLKIGL